MIIDGILCGFAGSGGAFCVGRSETLVAVSLPPAPPCIPTLVERAYAINFDIDIERLPLCVVWLCNFLFPLFIFIYFRRPMAVWTDSVPGRVSSALGAGAFFLSEGLVGPTWAGIRRGRKLIRWCPDSRVPRWEGYSVHNEWQVAIGL